MTEAFGRLLQTEEGRNQARQLIHAQANDEVDANSISTGSEATCDSEDWNSEEWESADEAEGSFGTLVVHDPVEYNSIHCPPFPSCEDTKPSDYLCDCYSYGEHYATCCLEWGENDPIDWNFWIESANAMKDIERLPNDVRRKVLNDKLWRTCNLGDTRGERIKLPNCGEVKVRQFFPQKDGTYMGFMAV